MGSSSLRDRDEVEVDVTKLSMLRAIDDEDEDDEDEDDGMPVDPLLPEAALLEAPLPLTVHLTVMVTGEAGVGKSTLAHFVEEAMPSHEGHMRRKMPPPTGETIDFDESRRFVLELPPPSRGGHAARHGAPSSAGSMGETGGGLGLTDVGTTVLCHLVDTPPAYGDTLDPRESIGRVVRYVEDALEERAAPEEAMRRHLMGAAGEGSQGRGPLRGRDKPLGSGFDCRVDVALVLLPPRRPQEPEVELMRRLSAVTTVVPAIAKADSLTASELAELRADVAEAIEIEGIPCVDLAGEVRAARGAARGVDRPTDAASPVLALVGGTVLDGGRAARVYPWGVCVPGGGAATAPAGLDDLVAALTSAEGVALLKARTETATSAWAAVAAAHRARAGRDTNTNTNNTRAPPVPRGGAILGPVFWAVLSLIASCRDLFARLGDASGGRVGVGAGVGDKDSEGPPGGWLRAARRQRAARKREATRGAGGTRGGAWDVVLRGLGGRRARLARLGINRGVQAAVIAGAGVFVFGAVLLASLPSVSLEVAPGGLMRSSGVSGLAGVSRASSAVNPTRAAPTPQRGGDALGTLGGLLLGGGGDPANHPGWSNQPGGLLRAVYPAFGDASSVNTPEGLEVHLLEAPAAGADASEVRLDARRPLGTPVRLAVAHVLARPGSTGCTPYVATTPSAGGLLHQTVDGKTPAGPPLEAGALLLHPGRMFVYTPGTPCRQSAQTKTKPARPTDAGTDAEGATEDAGGCVEEFSLALPCSARARRAGQGAPRLRVRVEGRKPAGGEEEPTNPLPPLVHAVDAFVAGARPTSIPGIRVDADALLGASPRAAPTLTAAPTIAVFALFGSVGVGAAGATAFARAGGSPGDLIETTQGVRAAGPPAALAALAEALEYRRPGFGLAAAGSADGETGRPTVEGGGTDPLTFVSQLLAPSADPYAAMTFGSDEVAVTLTGAGRGFTQQARVGVAVRAECRADGARVSGDGARGHSGPPGTVTAVEVVCRDGTGARVDALAARDEVIVEVAAGAEYSQTIRASPRKDGGGYVARFLRPATAYEVTVTVNGAKTKGSPVWVTVDENADLLKCGGYDGDGGDVDGGGGQNVFRTAAEDDGTDVEVLPQTGVHANPRFEFKVTKQELIRQKAEAIAAEEKRRRDQRDREKQRYENDFLAVKRKPRPRNRMGGDDRDYRDGDDKPKLLGRSDDEGGGVEGEPADEEEEAHRSGDADPLVIGRGENIGTIPRAFGSVTDESRGATFEAFAKARAQAMRDRAMGKAAAISRPKIMIDSGGGMLRPAVKRFGDGDAGGSGGAESGSSTLGDPNQVQSETLAQKRGFIQLRGEASRQEGKTAQVDPDALLQRHSMDGVDLAKVPFVDEEPGMRVIDRSNIPKLIGDDGGAGGVTIMQRKKGKKLGVGAAGGGEGVGVDDANGAGTGAGAVDGTIDFSIQESEDVWKGSGEGNAWRNA